MLEAENRFLVLSKEGRALTDSVRGKKYLLQSFLHEVLGVCESTADEDTCKIEHLVSNETAERLARFMRFVRSDDEHVITFREAWKTFTDPCEHDPSNCPACNLDCVGTMCGPESPQLGGC